MHNVTVQRTIGNSCQCRILSSVNVNHQLHSRRSRELTSHPVNDIKMPGGHRVDVKKVGAGRAQYTYLQRLVFRCTLISLASLVFLAWDKTFKLTRITMTPRLSSDLRRGKRETFNDHNCRSSRLEKIFPERTDRWVIPCLMCLKARA